MVYELDPILGVGGTVSKAYSGSNDKITVLSQDTLESISVTFPSRVNITYFAVTLYDQGHTAGVSSDELWTVELLRNNQVIRLWRVPFASIHTNGDGTIVVEVQTLPFELNINETLTLRYSWTQPISAGTITVRATMGLIGNYL